MFLWYVCHDCVHVCDMYDVLVCVVCFTHALCKWCEGHGCIVCVWFMCVCCARGVMGTPTVLVCMCVCCDVRLVWRVCVVCVHAYLL